MDYSNLRNTNKIVIVALTLILIASIILSCWHFFNDEHFDATSPDTKEVSQAPLDLIAKLAVIAAPPPAENK